MSELESCPCCGSSADVRDDCDDVSMDGNLKWWVCCSGDFCKQNTGGYYTLEDAINAWQCRPKPALPSDEEMEKLCDEIWGDIVDDTKCFPDDFDIRKGELWYNFGTFSERVIRRALNKWGNGCG